MEITHEDVTKLLAAVDGAPRLGQIDFRCGGFRMQIQRDGAGASSAHCTAAATARAAATIEITSSEGAVVVRAPMLGRFFREGSAAQPPLAEDGFRVAAHDVICLIKVGEQSNAIRAGVNGIAKCMVAGNGRLVEYAQELFVITPVSEG